ncbi:hypothetical protein GGR52DRAFT_219113 [Hypoxylon sp. FL1284]|nr:hypothetical protein GGR52DRAFT_219113 [Hypoxylon sp. FL1284]
MSDNSRGEPNKGIQCPHSDGKSTLVCWVCAENGYAAQRGGGSPKGEVSEEKILSDGTVDVSSLEVHQPGEGIEVGGPDPRFLYPGLEVVSGPIVKEDPEGWDAAQEQKAVLAPGQRTIFGLRRRVFWLVITGLLVVLLIGVAIGAAVGLTRNQHAADTPSELLSSTTLMTSSAISSATSSAMSQPSTSVSSTAASSTTSGSSTADSSTATSKTADGEEIGSTSILSSSTATKTTPSGTTATATETVLVTPPVSTPKPTTPSPSPTTPSPTKPSSPKSTAQSTTTASAPAQASGYCLGPDGSTYTDPDSGSQFRVECAVAHQGRDIENLKADSMQDCVALCAAEARCAGAIWYNVGPQGTDLNYCWLKSELDDTDVRDTRDAQSVVRLSS